MSSNPQLTDLDGLGALEQVDDDLWIDANPILADIFALVVAPAASLQSVGALAFSSNTSLSRTA